MVMMFGVVQPAGHLGFALEPLEERGGHRQLGVQGLDRDRALDARLQAFEDHAHAALTQHGLDLVPAVEDLADQFVGVDGFEGFLRHARSKSLRGSPRPCVVFAAPP